MHDDIPSDSDADSLYCIDECSPPEGPAPPFGTVLVGEIALQIDDALDEADEEPDPNDGSSHSGSGVSASDSSSCAESFAESDSSLDPVSIDDFPEKDFETHDKVASQQLADLSAVTLGKSNTSDAEDEDDAHFESDEELAAPKAELSAVTVEKLNTSDAKDVQDNISDQRGSQLDFDDLTPVHKRGSSKRPDAIRMRTSHFTPSASNSSSDTVDAKVEAADGMDSDDELFGVDGHIDDDASLSDETPPSSQTVGTFTSSGSVPDEQPKKRSIYPNIIGKHSQGAKSNDSSGKKNSGGFFGRASATFYRAFKKPSKSKDVKKIDPSRSPTREQMLQEISAWDPVEALKKEKEEETAHLKLEHHLTAQISTLRSAQSGFVDLTLLKPMTESTLAAVYGEATRIMNDLPNIERRKELVDRKFDLLKNTTESELAAKELLLVDAKLKLAEARGEVQTLKHELYLAQKHINEPKRIAARERYTLKVRRERAELELNAANESREKMEQKLVQRQESLERDTVEVKRLEGSVRDLEGDWA